MDFVRNPNLLQWTVSGLLLGAGFLYSILWPLGIIGVAYFLHLVQIEHAHKKLLLGGFISWTVKSLAAIAWFLSVYPIEWLSVSLGSTQILIVIFYWVTNAVWLGVGGVVAVFLSKLIYRSFTQKKVLIFLIPIVWVFSEIVGSLSFSILTYGDGGIITSAFSFGYVGYLLAEHHWLLQSALLYGVYGMSFIFVAIAMVGYWTAGYPFRKKIFILASIFILFWASSFVPLFDGENVSQSYYSVITIDTTFPVNYIRTENRENKKVQALETAMQTALDASPDYILLPEDTRYFNQSVPTIQAKLTFDFLHANPEVVIVDSGRAIIDGEAVLQAFTYNGIADTVDISQKRYLVPQGEFMPYFYSTALTLVGYGTLVESIEEDISYVLGSGTNQKDAATSTPGILYCFESVSPWGVKQIMKERATVPFIAHPVSHAWFNEPTILWKNLDNMLQVQAVWNQQYIVSAGGHVDGQVYTPQGKILTPEILASGDNWVMKQSFIPKSQ